MEQETALTTEVTEPTYEKDLYQLTPKEELFCVEYLRDRNATQAYIRAGYATKYGRHEASKLLAKPYVRAKINSLIRKQIESLTLSQKLVITELLKHATINIADAYNEDNSLKDIKDMPEPLQKAIVAIETEELFDGVGRDREHIGRTKRIKFSDRLQALEMLGRHLKMFTDVHEIPGLEDLAERMREARLRRLRCQKTQKTP